MPHREIPVPARESPTEYRALAQTHRVTPGADYATLFEADKIDTKHCKELRLFVHVMNNAYEHAPFPSGSSLTISAFHGIGRGSWCFFSARFEQRYTSELDGFVQIPVIGEVTRIVVSGRHLPTVELEVDVAALLVR